MHGTTLVTNAIIERKGAKLGLITTQGFRDILEMGTEQRYDIYDLFLSFPEPLVPRDRRLEVAERIDRDGAHRDARSTRARCAPRSRQLVADGVRGDRGLLPARLPQPGARAGRRRDRPRGVPRARRSRCRSEVVAELCEYQRCVTTCANAYVQPLMDRYLERLETRARRARLRRRAAADAFGRRPRLAGRRRAPSRSACSNRGPAGGGLATALFGELAGQKDVISFDMGGTTAKACLIEDGRAEIAPMMEAGRVHRFKKGSGLPIKAPVIDMIEIGAGGGSIAAIDEVGLLQVGPHSAGSDPGPACYGLGGTKPTVTDANLVLGYYDPGFFLGGRMTLDLEAARARRRRRVAEPLGLSAEEAAWGIHKVVIESMAAAARVHLVEKGKDPRDYAMVGFGGAGPAHAADVARVLGVREVIIPPASGAASALGFLAAPLSFELVRSHPVEFSARLRRRGASTRVLGELEARGPRAPGRGRRRRRRRHGRAHRRHAPRRPDARDHRAAAGRRDRSAASLDAIRDGLRARSTRRATPRSTTGARIEAINFRVRCVGPTPDAVADRRGRRRRSRRQAQGHRARPGSATASSRRRSTTATRCAPGDRIDGPAIIEEREATTVVPPGDSVAVDESLNLRIAIGVAAAVAPHRSRPTCRCRSAIARIEADPISLEIMWSRLVTVVEEMWLTVCRTAFSLIISEAQDFACELLDPEGETLAHSPRAMPVFNLTLPRAVKALLARYPAETLKPGDVLVTNDPWLCAGHLFDIAVVTPVLPRRPASSASSARSAMSPTSAAPRIRCAPARSTRRVSRSRR